MLNWTTDMLKDRIKCAEDIEYFAETYIKVTHAVHGLLPLKLNEFQRQAIKDYNEKRVFTKLTSRMQGKTTIAAVILLHDSIFNEYQASLVMGPNLQLSNHMLDLIYNMNQNLPEHIQAKIATRNKTILEFENMCSIISGGSSTNAGRGRTLSNIYIDESEFMTTFGEVFDDLYPAIAASNKGKLFAFTSTRTTEYFRDYS